MSEMHFAHQLVHCLEHLAGTSEALLPYNPPTCTARPAVLKNDN